MAGKQNENILLFAQFHSSVDEGFWHRLSSLKLNKLKTDESPIPITGFYAPCSNSQVSSHLTLLTESLPTESSDEVSTETSRGNRNWCSIPGTLYNKNTLEGFNSLDKNSLLNTEAKKIWEDIQSGRAEEDSAVLSRFLLISFADLKKYKFHYWFAFPALVLDPAATLVNLRPASQWFTMEEAKSVSACCNEWRKSSSTTDVPFFLVSIASNSHATIRLLKDWEACQREGHKILFAFYDPYHCQNNPGWPLRNFLALICARWNLEKVQFLCYRENHGFADLGLSLVGEAMIPPSQVWKDQRFPKAVGWESYKEKLVPRCINLSTSMDPKRMATSAAELNLKLMRWRALPSLDLNILSSTKCLLLGAGTLGCQVARMLMAWGVRKITLLDSGKVAMSNPLRQSLYTLDDCLNGGDFKASAAVKSLERIFPAVEAEGVVMAIPMPGHPVPSQEESSVLNDYRRLHDLIESHDVIFLLTDTKESRWLPTLLSANANKLTITAALGFDSFLVMRHGAGPLSATHGSKDEPVSSLTAKGGQISMTEGDGGKRLGCYFCNDVVAPVDSTAHRTLDQQCTVTRPGLAPIASALAVELLVGILHHPLGISAKAEFADSPGSESDEQPLGILPHQIHGTLSQFSQMILVGHSSKSCTACSPLVVSEYRERELDFVLQAINHPTYLEDLTGLTKLMKSANSFQLDWDNDTDYNDDGKFNRMVISAADLNLKLMRRALPSLDLNILSSTKCLLLGAGTLGCQVARMLMAWGVRKITLLDSGKVAMSNPLRQSLYTLDDCLNGGDFKASAAVKSLERIFPAVEAEGVVMAIPMPGHPVPSQEESSVLNDCKRLHDLIESHDVIFLLTDTRESRWLPTLLSANANKLTITAALGFDSFLVMRHGAGPLSATHGSKDEPVSSLTAKVGQISTTEGDGGQRLGCYFCNDVVAPVDSTANRTLDQQCTVTRPGLAPIASALAVELLVGILHHPLGISAKAEFADSPGSESDERPLGILPHQIRGALSLFSQMILVGHSSKSCTACSPLVVSEYRERGLDFVLQAINHPTYLEDLTGLTELMKSANSFQLDWDNDTDYNDDDDDDCVEI